MDRKLEAEIEDDRVRMKYKLLATHLTERQRRLWAGAEAEALDYSGISRVARATGLARDTVMKGIKEVREVASDGEAPERSRRAGGGRKPVEVKDPYLVKALDALVEPTSRGDPQSPLRWTCKSTRALARELTSQGHAVSQQKVGELLHEMGYSLQGNRKTMEGRGHPDRDAQFRYINERVKQFQRRGEPVISVDTKKKELIGPYKNGGKEWQPMGEPVPVKVHDFIDDQMGKAIPYGVYDVKANEGWVSVGVDHDTPEFAVQSIRWWWKKMGQQRYPDAKELLITADGGGSNGHRNRMWKVALQEFADEAGLNVGVSHFPPGTSKWNKIEHRMFCHITRNWRGKPLNDLETVVNLIGNTTTTTGLKIKARLDRKSYPIGKLAVAAELAKLKLAPRSFHGEWNYTLRMRIRRADPAGSRDRNVA